MLGFNFKRAPAPAAAPAPAPVVATPKRQRFNSVRAAVRSLFASADTNRLTASWGTTPLPADQIITLHQRALVARSREQSANNDYVRAFLRMCRQNIVGPQGIMLTAKAMTDGGKLDKAANEAIEWAFFEWSKPQNCDVKGKQSLRAIENSSVTTAAKDGEYFVRMVWGEPGGDAGPWGFALQTIDPQRCPVEMNEDRPQGGGFIRQGIHFNKFGRAVAYYFDTTDDSESNYVYGGRRYVKIPAEEIIHGFEEDMVGQKRGLPWMVTSLFRMRHLNGLEDAAVINARVGAAKMGFIQWKDGFGPEYQDEDDIPEISAEAGVFETLPEGAELKEWAPQYPSGEFAPFAKHLLRGAAAGFGVPYNELAADLEGVNFSSIRQGTLDSREHWKDKQEWLKEGLMQRIYDAWLPRALLAGRIKVRGKPLSAARIDRYSNIEWQARRWQWIDPRADVDAAVESKNNFLTSPSTIIREQGKDPLAVWQETARDMRDMVDALVKQGFAEDKATELVMLSMGRQPDKPVPPKAQNDGQNQPAAA